MRNFIEEILSCYSGHDSVKISKTPAGKDLFEETEKDDCSDTLCSQKEFHTVVAKLLYLCKRGQPYITVAVHHLCTRVKAPATKDVRALERVLGYLQGTMHYVRVFDATPFDRVRAYVDAAFSSHPDGRGRNGAILMLGNSPVYTSSHKQVLTAKNSTIAEIVAATDEISAVEKLQGFLVNQGYTLEPPLLFQDNTSAILLMSEDGAKQTNKHVRARIGAMLEATRANDVIIQYVPTRLMVADGLTKPL